MDRQRRIFLLNAAQLAALAAAAARRHRRGARERRRLSVQPRRRLRLAAAELRHLVDAHPGRSAQRRRHARRSPSACAGKWPRTKASGASPPRAPPAPCPRWRTACTSTSPAWRRPLVLVPLHAGRRGQPDRAHPHRAGAGRAAGDAQAGRRLVPALGIRQLRGAPPDRRRRARPGGLPGRLYLRVGAVPAEASGQIDAHQRIVHAGRLPRPLRAVQERSRPAGGAPRGAVDRDLGRP